VSGKALRGSARLPSSSKEPSRRTLAARPMIGERFFEHLARARPRPQLPLTIADVVRRDGVRMKRVGPFERLEGKGWDGTIFGGRGAC